MWVLPFEPHPRASCPLRHQVVSFSDKNCVTGPVAQFLSENVMFCSRSTFVAEKANYLRFMTWETREGKVMVQKIDLHPTIGAQLLIVMEIHLHKVGCSCWVELGCLLAQGLTDWTSGADRTRACLIQ